MKWLWKAAWTELNFCKVFICRKRSMARSRRRKGKGFQHLALVIDGSPEVVHFAVDLGYAALRVT